MPLAADRVYLAEDVTIPTGGLLPHPFTLTIDRGLTANDGGLLSVALALRLLWPSVRWSPASHAARTFLSRHMAASYYLPYLRGDYSIMGLTRAIRCALDPLLFPEPSVDQPGHDKVHAPDGPVTVPPMQFRHGVKVHSIHPDQKCQRQKDQ